MRRPAAGRLGLQPTHPIRDGVPRRIQARLAGGLGFEPRLTESESAVLPLNYPPPIQVWRHALRLLILQSQARLFYNLSPFRFPLVPAAPGRGLLIHVPRIPHDHLERHAQFGGNLLVLEAPEPPITHRHSAPAMRRQPGHLLKFRHAAEEAAQGSGEMITGHWTPGWAHNPGPGVGARP